MGSRDGRPCEDPGEPRWAAAPWGSMDGDGVGCGRRDGVGHVGGGVWADEKGCGRVVVGWAWREQGEGPVPCSAAWSVGSREDVPGKRRTPGTWPPGSGAQRGGGGCELGGTAGSERTSRAVGLPPNRESAVVCDSLSVVDGGRCVSSPVCRPAGLVPAAGGLEGLLALWPRCQRLPRASGLFPCATGQRGAGSPRAHGEAVARVQVAMGRWADRSVQPGDLCGLSSLVAAGWSQAQGPTGQESGPESRKQCDPAWRRKTEVRLDLGCQKHVDFKPQGRGSFRMRTGSEVVQGPSEG